MAAQGIASPFEISELSILGILEGVAAYGRVVKRADEAAALATEAGFEVSQADLLKNQEANQTLELSDEEPEGVAGGGFMSLCWGGNQVLLVRLLPGGCMLSKPFYSKDDRQQQAHWLASGLISMPKN
jgi:hypothetical protein